MASVASLTLWASGVVWKWLLALSFNGELCFMVFTFCLLIENGRYSRVVFGVLNGYYHWLRMVG